MTGDGVGSLVLNGRILKLVLRFKTKLSKEVLLKLIVGEDALSWVYN